MSGSLVKKILLAFPSLPEQRALASYFTSLDAQIAASTSRLSSLKQIKAASLLNMFPQKGETVPRVRFKGFQGEWKERKLGELAIVQRGLTYFPTDIVKKEGVRVLRSSNIEGDTFVISDDDVFVSKKCINIEYICKGDILITAANGSMRLVGKHSLVKNIDNSKQVAGGFMFRMVSKWSTFLDASMNTEWYNSFLKRGVSGGNGSIGNLNKKELEDSLLPIPIQKEEIDAIASYFTTLDAQITLQRERLEKLKQIKAACLEKMFA